MVSVVMVEVLNAKPPAPAMSKEEFAAYKKVVDKTIAMVRDKKVRALARHHGMRVMDVTWEDTGRFKNSSVGPNISDVTIQVQLLDPATKKYSLHCMPVIRFPNFTDKTADIRPFEFKVLTGNEKGKMLEVTTLDILLSNLRNFLHEPKSWAGDKQSLLVRGDTHVLVSAQACFLPIPKGGKAEFNPVIFNYQSSKKNPAVLTILVTREGTSITVIDNVRDRFAAGATWGQRLFFNQKGKRASLTGTRLSDFRADQADRAAQTDQADQPDPGDLVRAAAFAASPKRGAGAASPKLADQGGLNMVLMIQVPLIFKRRPPPKFSGGGGGSIFGSAGAARPVSDVEEAVIGHGKIEGPFTEIDQLPIRRDPRFPIRVTVQFYKATSNGVVTEQDMADIAKQIQKVYKQGDYVGSLVTGGDTRRPTEYTGSKIEPPDWWHRFWQRHYKNTRMTPAQTWKLLRRIHGPNWMPRSEKELGGALELMIGG